MCPLAVIKFIDKHGNPIDPGFGNGEGGNGDSIDNTLPGDSNGPVDPGFGGGIGARPPHIWGGPPRPWPPLPWPPRPFPPGPTDPDWGVGGGPGNHPGMPIFIPPDRVDNTLPPVASTKPPANPPPGTIWPPIPGAPEGKYAVLVWIIGIGWRYAVVEAPPPPDAGTKPVEPPSTKPITPPPATPK